MSGTVNFFTTQTGPTCHFCGSLVIPKSHCVNGCSDLLGCEVTIVSEPVGDVEIVKVEKYDGGGYYTARIVDGEYDGFSIGVRVNEEHVRWIRGWHAKDSEAVTALLAIRATGVER